MLLNPRHYNCEYTARGEFASGRVWKTLRDRKCRFEVSYHKGSGTFLFEGTQEDYDAVVKAAKEEA